MKIDKIKKSEILVKDKIDVVYNGESETARDTDTLICCWGSLLAFRG